jgi:ribose-phosphate pyrophosphokinase
MKKLSNKIGVFNLSTGNIGPNYIRYTKDEYPDSHSHLKINQPALSVMSYIDKVEIRTRLSSMNDVFILLQAVDSLRSVRPRIAIDLIISYLICGRYDRPMHNGDSFDLKIIADLINSQGFDRVTVLEPHSLMTTNLLRAATVHPLDDILREKLQKFRYPQHGTDIYSDVCLVAPDIGAIKRVEAFAKTLEKPIPIVTCNKDRDVLTGEIKGVIVMNPDQIKNNVFIYDDLCDGGRTFIEVARALRKQHLGTVPLHITLVVTHGLFSKGYDCILEEIDHIITTNSYKPLPSKPNVTVVKVI